MEFSTKRKEGYFPYMNHKNKLLVKFSWKLIVYFNQKGEFLKVASEKEWNRLSNKLDIQFVKIERPQIIKKDYFLLRVLLSPLIFIYSIVLLLAGTLFPLPFLVLISLMSIIAEPFLFLLRKSGANIPELTPFFDDIRDDIFGHFIGLTIYIWFPFFVVHKYIKSGEIYSVIK